MDYECLQYLECCGKPASVILYFTQKTKHIVILKRHSDLMAIALALMKFLFAK